MSRDDNWKTLRVPPEDYEEAKAQKEAAGRTWGDQIVRPDDDATELSDVAESAAAIEERLGQLERTLEELQG
jgi:hypothetical protein